MIQRLDDQYPQIPSSAYVHPTAVVIGEVSLGEMASVWPNAVLRGDTKRIVVGAKTNIQDGCVVHTGKYSCKIGSEVLVGHGAMLHSCEIGERCMIGMGAIILDAAKVGSGCIVAAGAVIPGGKVIPPGSVVMGNPGEVVRKTTSDEVQYITENCGKYVSLAAEYKRTGDIL